MSLQSLPVLAVTQSVADSYSIIFHDESDDDQEELMDHELELLVKSYDKKVPASVKLFVEVIIPRSSAREFQADFRIMRSTFEKLLHLIGPKLIASQNVGR